MITKKDLLIQNLISYTPSAINCGGLFLYNKIKEKHCFEQCYLYPSTITCEGLLYWGSEGENMVETINSWLPIVSALIAGLLFIWRITNNLNKTLLSLTNGIERLNQHLNEVDETAKDSAQRINNHEVRIVVLEKVAGIQRNTGESVQYENQLESTSTT